jgi:hypothetical protein
MLSTTCPAVSTTPAATMTALPQIWCMPPPYEKTARGSIAGNPRGPEGNMAKGRPMKAKANGLAGWVFEPTGPMAPKRVQERALEATE